MYQPGNNSSWPKVHPDTGRASHCVWVQRPTQALAVLQSARVTVGGMLVCMLIRHIRPCPLSSLQLLGVLRFLVDYLNYEHKRAVLLPQQASLGAAHEHWENCEPPC
jgi:hypothetical protein